MHEKTEPQEIREDKSTTIIDFSKPPKKLDQFRLGDRLTRENFMSFLIMSFAISRGNRPSHRAFFLWLEKRWNKGFSRAVRDFLNFFFFGKEGWQNLPEEEWKMFESAYRQIKKHIKLEQLEQVSERNYFLRKALQDELSMLVSKKEFLLIKKYFDFEQIKTLGDFLKATENCIRATEQND